jgi:hypothetical protein
MHFLFSFSSLIHLILTPFFPCASFPLCYNQLLMTWLSSIDIIIPPYISPVISNTELQIQYRISSHGEKHKHKYKLLLSIIQIWTKGNRSFSFSIKQQNMQILPYTKTSCNLMNLYTSESYIITYCIKLPGTINLISGYNPHGDYFFTRVIF